MRFHRARRLAAAIHTAVRAIIRAVVRAVVRTIVRAASAAAGCGGACSAAALLLVLPACTTQPPSGASSPLTFIDVPSPNHGERRPNFIILHQTSNDNVQRALRTLTNPAREVSAHYLIGRDGVIHRLVAESRRAWHAGVSWWGGLCDLNSASIGIELDNNGAEPFAAAQIDKLLTLLRDLRQRYNIPAANVLGHGDIAPGRKVDPGVMFPWARLAAHGHGLWCRDHEGAAGGGDVRLLLAALGYNIGPAAGDEAPALAAFRRHFRGIESSAAADDGDAALLRCLLQARHDEDMHGSKRENKR